NQPALDPFQQRGHLSEYARLHDCQGRGKGGRVDTTLASRRARGGGWGDHLPFRQQTLHRRWQTVIRIRAATIDGLRRAGIRSLSGDARAPAPAASKNFEKTLASDHAAPRRLFGTFITLPLLSHGCILAVCPFRRSTRKNGHRKILAVFFFFR